MVRRPQLAGAFLVSASAIGLAGRAARAAPNDAPATELRDDAVNNDYLATNYASAEVKLKAALSLCQSPADCSPAIRSRLLSDLGVVEFMLGHAEGARVQFAAALKEDPTLVLDPDLSTPDLERAFAAAKRDVERPVSADKADCPPSFPGCSASCTSSEECGAGEICANGACIPSSEPASRTPYKAHWLSVAFEENALLLPSAANACAGGTGYTCFNGSAYYSGIPLANADDQVNGGIALATSRILIGYDHAIRENFTAGVRVGYAFGGGPQRPTASSFLPIHGEVRLTYWFGDEPLGQSGVRFFLLAAGGIAEIDASLPVNAYANLPAYANKQSESYQAWKKTGLAFGAIGGGAMFAITPATGVALEAKGIEMFPTTATGFGAQLAYVVGL
jgi:hypothetical protein